MAVTTERIGTAMGVLAPVVALGGILVATAVAPWFSWSGNALSDLGVRTGTAALFNGGLILGGALSLPFSVRIGQTARNAVERIGAGLFAVTGVLMGAIGVFPSGDPLHFPVALSFYVMLSLTLWVYGAGNLFDSDRTVGAFTLLGGATNLGAWLVWYYSLRSALPGLAVPEIVGAVVLACWTVVTAARLW